jgi:hypothetical protein
MGTAVATDAPQSETEQNGSVDTGLSMGALMENLHGVQVRDTRPQKRQKRDDQPDGVENDKATFIGGGGKGGVVGQYMRDKREEGRKEAAKKGTVVDLTEGKIRLAETSGIID